MAIIEELKGNYEKYINQYYKCTEYSRDGKKDIAQSLILEIMQVCAQNINRSIMQLDDITAREVPS